MAYLEDRSREVSWTVSMRVVVGHHECIACTVETPGPSKSELLRFAMSRESFADAFMWPGDDWMPNGWSKGGEGLLCPECTKDHKRWMATRRKGKR